MTLHASPFLTAEWRHLAMLNFDIDPSILRPLVPTGTELDDWRGRTFVSVVGFLFLNTRVFSAAIPFHRDFEEVNLRFYVRRKASDGWRRAVVFVKEIVPRLAIALTARALYGENYVAVPMRHRIAIENGCTAGLQSVLYSWRFCGRENRMELSADGQAGEVVEGSNVEFITGTLLGLRSATRRVHDRISRRTSALESLHGNGNSGLRRGRTLRSPVRRVLAGSPGLCVSR